MSKFAALAADVSNAFPMKIVSPRSDAVLKDASGKDAFISLLSPDSEVGRRIDREQSQQVVRKLRAGRTLGDDEDLNENEIAKLAALTVDWYLLDLDGNHLDVPFSMENARELWTDPAMGWLRRQAWVFVNSAGNFIKGSAKP